MIMTTLLSGCKSKQAENNPLLETWSTPFGVPPFDKIKTEHFKPAVEAGICLHEAQIDFDREKHRNPVVRKRHSRHWTAAARC